MVAAAAAAAAAVISVVFMRAAAGMLAVPVRVSCMAIGSIVHFVTYSGRIVAIHGARSAMLVLVLVLVLVLLHRIEEGHSRTRTMHRRNHKGSRHAGVMGRWVHEIGTRLHNTEQVCVSHEPVAERARESGDKNTYRHEWWHHWRHSSWRIALHLSCMKEGSMVSCVVELGQPH